LKVDYSILTFGQIIRLAREEKHLSRSQLIKALNWSLETLISVEEDKHMPVSVVNRLCNYFTLDKVIMARLNLYNSRIWKDYYNYIKKQES
jgi:ribosome-binding protein aMBF1 (putative translation factor)